MTNKDYTTLFIKKSTRDRWMQVKNRYAIRSKRRISSDEFLRTLLDLIETVSEER